jgi:glycosyltransferase involved in cell wall biosynthesis
VTTHITGIPELIRHGVEGLLVAPSDVDGLVAALSSLIDDPATLCFVCGPAAMVDDVPRMLGELGIDRSRIRVEEW